MTLSRGQSRSEQGSALLLAVMATTLMLAMGAALVLVTTTETRIASRFARGVETLAAAEAVMERALLDLVALPDWDAALAGAAVSAFADGAPIGIRRVGDVRIDLATTTDQLRCGRDVCAAADIEAVTAARPRGRNNPRWQLFAWGPLSALVPVSPDRDVYVLVWVGDDPAENDGDPVRDGTRSTNPGRWTVALVGQAFGAGGLRRRLEVTVTRAGPVPPGGPGMPPGPLLPAGPGPAQILTWREVR